MVDPASVLGGAQYRLPFDDVVFCGFCSSAYVAEEGEGLMVDAGNDGRGSKQEVDGWNCCGIREGLEAPEHVSCEFVQVFNLLCVEDDRFQSICYCWFDAGDPLHSYGFDSYTIESVESCAEEVISTSPGGSHTCFYCWHVVNFGMSRDAEVNLPE